ILFVANQALERIVGARALFQVETHAQLLASRLGDKFQDIKDDLSILTPAPSLWQLIEMRAAQRADIDALSKSSAYERVATFLRGHLAGRSFYLQFSIIQIDDGGRELLRLERSTLDQSIRVIPADQLARKEQSPYLTELAKLKPGEFHFWISQNQNEASG